MFRGLEEHSARHDNHIENHCAYNGAEYMYLGMPTNIKFMSILNTAATASVFMGISILPMPCSIFVSAERRL